MEYPYYILVIICSNPTKYYITKLCTLNFWVTPKELSRNDLTISLLIYAISNIKKGGELVYTRYTKDEFYDEIVRIHNQYGYINTNILKNNINLELNINHWLHKYGGLKNICKELSLNYIHALRSDREDIKQDFYNIYETVGYINIETYLKHGKYSKQSIKTAFGSVNNLMKELGIPLNTSRMEDEETVLQDIKNVCTKYNSTSTNVYRKYGQYSECVINRIFGKWENALMKLNLSPVHKMYGKEEIDRQVIAIFDKYGFISKSLIDDECDFTYQALKPYYKNKNQLSKMLGVDNAFCDKSSSKARVIHLILYDLYDEIETEQTWDWLINDRTNKHMYVDFFIPSINTAIEFDGKQHFNYFERYHKTYEGFLNSVYRDKLKDRLLNENGIRLIRISYKDKISKSYILNLLDKAN